MIGYTDPCEVQFGFRMELERIHEDPRVTLPYSEARWADIDALARKVDAQLHAWDVRLTMGGEPTFVSIDDMDGVEWNTAALGERKRELAGELWLRLREQFAPGSLLHEGQGKWYPGEPLPRWALTCLWRADGKPLWKNADLLAGDRIDPAIGIGAGTTLRDEAGRETGFACRLRDSGIRGCLAGRASEQKLPVNLDPLKLKLGDSLDRKRLSSLLNKGLGEAVGYVLPLKPEPQPRAQGVYAWRSSPWPLRREHLYLLAGDSPMGFRLPLESLPWIAPQDVDPLHAPDPFQERAALREAGAAVAVKVRMPVAPRLEVGKSAVEIIHTALCVQARGGKLCVFFPPLTVIEDWIDLVGAVETVAADLKIARFDRRLCAAVRSAHPALCGYARPRRDRGQHPSGVELGGIEQQHPRSLRTGAPDPPGHRKIHARRPAYRNGRRQSRHHRRRDAGRQSAAAASRSAQEPDHLLAEPSGAVLSVLRHVHRPHQPGPARGRSAQRQPVRTGDRFPADAASATSLARKSRSPGSSTGCCAICWWMSPAIRIVPNSPSTSSTARTVRWAGWACWSFAHSKCRHTGR